MAIKVVRILGNMWVLLKKLALWILVLVALILILYAPSFLSLFTSSSKEWLDKSNEWLEYISKTVLNWITLSFVALVYFRKEIRELIKRVKKAGNYEFYNPSGTVEIEPTTSNRTEQTQTKQTNAYPMFNYMQLIILHTLIYYQIQHHGEDFSKRWGFNIHPESPSIAYFRYSIDDLIMQGLVFHSQDLNMYHLTEAGYNLCKEYDFGFKELILRFP
jgi:hypothetical protein